MICPDQRKVVVMKKTMMVESLPEMLLTRTSIFPVWKRVFSQNQGNEQKLIEFIISGILAHFVKTNFSHHIFSKRLEKEEVIEIKNAKNNKERKSSI